MTDFNKDHYLGVKKKLDEVSSCFCLAKWLHVTMHLHVGQCHSCYHSQMHDIPTDLLKADPSVLHNTPYKVERRKEMLEGKRPTECQFCWTVEDLGGVSDRLNFSQSSWAAPSFEKIDKKNAAVAVNPTYVEVSFSNQCNFKCSYCSPTASSRWAKELREEGSYPVRDPAFTFVPKTITEETNPWIQAWWNWFPRLYRDLRVLRVTGGEPLLSANTFRLLDFLADNPNPDLDFYLNSNMGVPRVHVERLVSGVQKLTRGRSVNHFNLYTSMDSWGPQAEYIRHGLDLGVFEENIRLFLEGCPDASLSFMITFQCLSLPGFTSLLEKIIELKKRYNVPGCDRIQYSIDQLVKPTHQHILLLPREFHRHMDRIERFMIENIHDGPDSLSDKQLDRFRVIYQWMRNNEEYAGVEADRADFFRFFSRHDAIRGVSLTGAFPEFREFWELCRREASPA